MDRRLVEDDMTTDEEEEEHQLYTITTPRGYVISSPSQKSTMEMFDQVNEQYRKNVKVGASQKRSLLKEETKHEQAKANTAQAETARLKAEKDLLEYKTRREQEELDELDDGARAEDVKQPTKKRLRRRA